MNKKIVLLGALTLCVTTASFAMEKQHKETQELINWVTEQQRNENTQQETQHEETPQLINWITEQQRKLSGKDDTTKKKGESTETLRNKTFEEDFEEMLQDHPTLDKMSEKEWMKLCTDEALDAYWAEIFNKE